MGAAPHDDAACAPQLAVAVAFEAWACRHVDPIDVRRNDDQHDTDSQGRHHSYRSKQRRSAKTDLNDGEHPISTGAGLEPATLGRAAEDELMDRLTDTEMEHTSETVPSSSGSSCCSPTSRASPTRTSLNGSTSRRARS